MMLTAQIADYSDIAGAAHKDIAAHMLALQKSFAPLVATDSFAGRKTGETPTRRRWDVQCEWELLPSDRAVALAQLHASMSPTRSVPRSVLAERTNEAQSSLRTRGPGDGKVRAEPQRRNAPPFSM